MNRFAYLTLAVAFAMALPIATRAQCNQDFILVTTTDYSTGSTTSLNPSTKAPSTNLELIGTDAVARVRNGHTYIVNRAGGDNIQELDACSGFDTIHQFSTGNGSNPHDIYLYSPTVAYVTRYDMTTVLKMNPQTGATLGTINIGAFADADGIPEMDQFVFAGGYLCVALQRLDRNNFYAPTGTSYLVPIDLATDTVVDTNPGMNGVQPYTLLKTDPYSEVSYTTLNNQAIAYFSAVGYFGVLDGGLLSIDEGDPSVQSTILTETAAGGDILDAIIVSDTKGFAIVATPSFTTILIAFNPTTGAKIGSTLYAPGGYDLNDIELTPDGSTLLLTDRKATNPGIRCFDVATSTQTTVNPINTGLPPFDIAVNRAIPTGATNTPRAATSLGSNYPNPFNPTTSIPFTLARTGHATLRIFDVTGRVVATLLNETAPAGAHVVRWDGRSDRGARVASGVYVARLDADDMTATRRIVLLK